MSIIKRGGIWHCHFFVNGVRYRQSLETPDRREAIRREKDLIAKASEGKLAVSGTPFARLDFGPAMDIYLEERKPRLRPKTIQTERERSRILRPRLGDIPLRKITAQTITHYMTGRTKQGVSNSTVDRELEIIRGVLKRAKRWAMLADDVHPLPKRRRFGRALSYDEKVKLEHVAKQQPGWQSARLAMILALNTTMRSDEIRNLCWRDVDLIEKAVTIRRSKTEAGERVIPLNGSAMAAIRELRERAKLMFGDTLNSDWYLFPRGINLNKPDPTRPTEGWRTAWRNIRRKAGLGSFRFHDLRHHAITELAESGAADGTIRAIAGHVSQQMLEHYSHIRMAAKRAAMEQLSGSHDTVTTQRPVSEAFEESVSH